MNSVPHVRNYFAGDEARSAQCSLPLSGETAANSLDCLDQVAKKRNRRSSVRRRSADGLIIPKVSEGNLTQLDQI